MCYLKNLFQFSFESDSSISYIIIKNVDDALLQKLQIEMIEQNPCTSLIPLSLRGKNNENMIYYNVTSKIALKDFLERNTLKKIDFLNILHDIVKTILDSKNYYANDNNFAIDEKYIFVNQTTSEIAMMYIPIDFDVDFKSIFKRFVKKILDDLVKIKDVNDLGFMQQIRMYLREETFNLTDFLKFLNTLKLERVDFRTNERCSDSNDSIKIPNVENVRQNNSDVKANSTNNSSVKPSKNKVSEDKKRISIPPSNSKNNNLKNNNLNNNLNNANKKLFIPQDVNASSNSNIKMKYPNSIKIIASIIQIAILAIIAVVSVFVMKAKEPDPAMIFGCVIVLGAIDFLILRKLFDKNKMIEAVCTSNKSENQNNIRNNLLFNNNENTDLNENPVINDNKEIPDRNNSEKASEIFAHSLESTVILLDNNKIAYLEGKDNKGERLKIVINKTSFVIGRHKYHTDFELNYPIISKVHTEIITKNGCYYIKDLDSSNGTYVNENRLSTNQEYEIKNGDSIRIANIELEFCING